MEEMVLLGDEAIAMGAIHAGISTAYGYPGTPSTEIIDFMLKQKDEPNHPYVSGRAKEKAAYEEALGTSMVGKRSLVTMKHVGLNVAADPFMNSALLDVHGGLVVVVADDPGQHSSQNEQDSRYFADMAKIMCLEPTNGQQAYEMIREAYDLSEQFKIPIMIRLVTRVAHSRSKVKFTAPKAKNELSKLTNSRSWTLLPANSRVQWNQLVNQQDEFKQFTCTSKYNTVTHDSSNEEQAVITTGIASNFFLEINSERESPLPHLHIGAYPIPEKMVQEFASKHKNLLVVEEGYPYVERLLRGIYPNELNIKGKESGHLPMTGELTVERVATALELPEKSSTLKTPSDLPNRPPQLCKGCPHADSFNALKAALAEYKETLVASDIGCYTLGALPPYSAIESCVCMGASVGLAKGAADAGFFPVIGVLGDSTFLHSGIQTLIGAAKANTNMTLMILDNETVAMTGGQETLVPSSQFKDIVASLGVSPEHLHVINAHPKHDKENTALIKQEIDYRGLSVIIAVRACIKKPRPKNPTK